jgi:hypothetical protein
MIRHEDTIKGRHYWALSRAYGKLIVLKMNEGYSVCGYWEGDMPEKDIEIIEEVPEPESLKSHPLYYGESE